MGFGYKRWEGEAGRSAVPFVLSIRRRTVYFPPFTFCPFLLVPAWIPKRKRWRLLGIYLVLLLASHVWQWLVPRYGQPQPDQQAVLVDTYISTSDPQDESLTPTTTSTGDKVTLYYRDLVPPGKPDAPVLMLLHGSLVTAHGRDDLVQALAPDFRLIVPDLPGFGASVGPRLPDYSPADYAAQISDLIDVLKLDHAHLVAFGMGGAVALELADVAPRQVQSLVLIDSVGTTEFSWLGEPMLNKAIYGAQLGIFNTAHSLLPHFGWLNTGPFNLASARIYWDAPQSRVRQTLKTYFGPLLIVHAQDDFLSPLVSARENNRIVPQSRLFAYPGGHWAGMHQPALIAPAIREFVNNAERGLEPVKSKAEKARVRAARQPVVIAGPSSRTYEAMLLVILSVLTLFGEDATCIGAGLLIAQGVLGYWEVMGACLVAILAGNLMYYVVGWRFGAPALKHPLFSWAIKESDLRRMTALYHQRGTWIVFVSRFVPASRLPVFMSAGILRFSFARMVGALIISNLLFTPLFIWSASLFGTQMLSMAQHYHKAALLVVVVSVVLGLAAMHIVQPLCTWRGRRLWRAGWRQMMHWQYWPAWQVQILLLPVLWRRSRRHGRFLTFTCANPEWPAGGFLGEPKSTYLRALAQAGASIPRWTTLPAAAADSTAKAEMRAADLELWMAQARLTWPMVLKREIGGMGRGVCICRQHEEARNFFRVNLGDVVVQELAAGVEFSIWFVREPGAPSVRLLAVSEAQYPSVTGDGKHSLDHLILADDRTLPFARIYQAKFAARLADIPAAGEVILLAELTHRRNGAWALDVTTAAATAELTAAIDELSRRMGRFNFGRFTVRCPSRVDLRAGRNLCFLGAAGVKAAGSSIRDPRRTLREAWRQTTTQWDLVYAIGADQRAGGVKPASWKAVLRGWLRAEMG